MIYTLPGLTTIVVLTRPGVSVEIMASPCSNLLDPLCNQTQTPRWVNILVEKTNCRAEILRPSILKEEALLMLLYVFRRWRCGDN